MFNVFLNILEGLTVSIAFHFFERWFDWNRLLEIASEIHHIRYVIGGVRQVAGELLMSNVEVFCLAFCFLLVARALVINLYYLPMIALRPHTLILLPKVLKLFKILKITITACILHRHFSVFHQPVIHISAY